MPKIRPKLLPSLFIWCLSLMAFLNICQAEKREVVIYTSMKEAQLSALKFGFMKKHPEIEVKYEIAGSGTIMQMLQTEESVGRIKADLLWLGEPSCYYILKEKGLLAPYYSPKAKKIPKGLSDRDNYYCGARMVTVGIVYNSRNLQADEIPTDWNDLLHPRYKGLIAMTDPYFSGTALYTVSGLYQNPKYGLEYFRGLKKNGIHLEKSAVTVVKKVGSGVYQLCIGVDYITKTIKENGGPVEFIYPRSSISTIPSPIAIFRGAPNMEEVKKLYDYILSIEGQLILMKENVILVRPEVKLEGAISIKEAVNRSLPVDNERLVLEKALMLTQFEAIMK